jgi:hypothetical protein
MLCFKAYGLFRIRVAVAFAIVAILDNDGHNDDASHSDPRAPLTILVRLFTWWEIVCTDSALQRYDKDQVGDEVNQYCDQQNKKVRGQDQQSVLRAATRCKPRRKSVDQVNTA